MGGLSVYSSRAPGHEMPTTIEEVGARRTGAGSGGNLRAAVLGVNDGLVSHASLIPGLAGASSQSEVMLSGVAGLLAGAFSMAAGECISVRSQRELFESQIALERAELAEYPREEAAELALIYAARGIPKDEAQGLADRIVADPARALDTLAREELGLDPEELGSPIGAAAFSFGAFAIGASIPLAPFLFLAGRPRRFAARSARLRRALDDEFGGVMLARCRLRSRAPGGSAAGDLLSIQPVARPADS